MRQPIQTHVQFISLAHLTLAAKNCHKFGYGVIRVYSALLTFLE